MRSSAVSASWRLWSSSNIALLALRPLLFCWRLLLLLLCTAQYALQRRAQCLPYQAHEARALPLPTQPLARL